MSKEKLDELKNELVKLAGEADKCIDEFKSNFTQATTPDQLIQPGSDLTQLIYEQSCLRDGLSGFIEDCKRWQSKISEKFDELKKVYSENVNVQIKQSEKDALIKELEDFTSTHKIASKIEDLSNNIINSKQWERKFNNLIQRLQNDLDTRNASSVRSKRSKALSVKSNLSQKLSDLEIKPSSSMLQQKQADDNVLKNSQQNNSTFHQPQNSSSQPPPVPQGFQHQVNLNAGLTISSPTGNAQIPATIIINEPFLKPTKYHVYRGKHSEFRDFMEWFEETFEQKLPHWTDAQRGQQLKDSTEGAPHLCVSAFQNSEYHLMKDHLRRNFGLASKIQKELMEAVKSLPKLEKVSLIGDFYFMCVFLSIRLKKHLPGYGDVGFLQDVKQRISEKIRAEIKRHLLDPNTQDLDQYLEALKQTGRFFEDDLPTSTSKGN